MYSQSNVEIPGLPAVQVKYIDVVFKQPQPFSGAQTYKLDLDACVVVGGVCMPIPGKDQTFTDGRFIASPVINEGSMFLPRSSDPQNPINQILKIQWCPDQNYFLVAFFGQMLLPLTHHPTVFSAVSPLGATQPATKKERSTTATKFAVGFFKQYKEKKNVELDSTGCTVACTAAEVACQVACALEIIFEPECGIACTVVESACSLACNA